MATYDLDRTELNHLLTPNIDPSVRTTILDYLFNGVTPASQLAVEDERGSAKSDSGEDSSTSHARPVRSRTTTSVMSLSRRSKSRSATALSRSTRMRLFSI
jgi:hypothetical protein